MRVETDRGFAVPGLTVRVAGPTTTTMVSDANGYVDIIVAGGSYTATIDVGCTTDYQVQHVATAHVDVPVAETVSGTLTVAAARRVAVVRPTSYHRVAPPVPEGQAGSDSEWHIGQGFQVTFHTMDRCSGKPAAGADLRTTRFVPGDGYKVAASPQAVTDAAGAGYVQVTCTTPNAIPQLLARSAIDDRDSLDLLGYDSLDRAVPSCRP
jgi:hypothetical protein